MNYKKIYYQFMNYCKETTPLERLLKRNKNDFRKDNENIYTESHHIVPRHAGGTDDDNNLVNLLPEEHYFAHLLRWRAYNSRKDFLAVRFIVNGIENKKEYIERCGLEYDNIRKRIARYRQHIYEFRKTHGWQTPEGRESISEARKNTFPCIDKETGISVGSQRSDHPNVISGKWVHHSKGKMSVIRISDNKKLYITTEEFKNNKELYKLNFGRDQSGYNNSNYKELTDEFYNVIVESVPLSIENNHFNKSNFVKLLKTICKGFGYNKISEAFLVNKLGKDWANVILNDYNSRSKTEYVYNPKYRGFESYKNVSKKAWVTNGIEDKVILYEDLDNFLKMNVEFYRGRKKK